jgi:sugar lactone lactonase YvrE
VYVHDPYTPGSEARVFPMPSFTGTVVPTADAALLLVALKDGIHELNTANGSLRLLANPDGVASNRWNDGKCSPEGRFWGGTMGEPGKVLPGVGSLYVLHRDGSAERALAGVTISNGLAWSSDGATLFYIDTPTGEVAAFDYCAASGALANRRSAFKIPAGTGHPDGCCMDSQGNLWVAQWGGSRVVAYRPSDGSIVAEVRLPAAHVSSCTFGGPGLADLYITTAKEHLSAEERAAQPDAGCCFLVRNIGWTGVPACTYRPE